jgi:DNA (cytosine-5)-methyltransferase 1
MHLFAGIGGGLLADLILGHQPVVAVEWDAYACKVLRERAADGWFPGLSVWEGDVRLFDPSEYTGVVDCIHAGFPCQDISVAGKQAGVSEGTRSGLYREVLRIAGVVRPRQLFLENVSAILANGLGTVLGDLAALGYDCRWLCIRASDVGAPHHRDRWFLLANSNNAERQARSSDGMGEVQSAKASSCAGSDELLSDTNNDRCRDGSVQYIGRQLESSANAGNDGEEGVMADADSAQRQGNKCTKRGEQEYPNIGGASWWAVEPELGRVAHGVPNRVGQLKGFGNAQVPIQAAAAYRLLGGI